MVKLIYSIESDKLVARNEGAKALVWENNFGGAKVFKILPLENDKGCIVLLDPGSSNQPTFENLMLISPSGDLYWKLNYQELTMHLQTF
jgi:hypothetical protein